MTLYASTASGSRSRLIPSPARFTRSRAQTDGTRVEHSQSSSDNQSPPPPSFNRRSCGRRLATVASISADSASSNQQDVDPADASDEDDQSGEETPAVFAPSHVHSEHGAGHFLMDLPEFNPQNTLPWTFDDDDDDDDLYEAVNDIPDDDDETTPIDDDFLGEIQKTLLTDEHFLFHIDSLSDFGFERSDIEYDDQWQSTSDDDEDMHAIMPPPQPASHDRHIHFEDLTSPSHVLTKDVSPLLTRTLLPSLITDVPALGAPKAATDTMSTLPTPQEEDFYDSDETVEDLSLQSAMRNRVRLNRPSTETSRQATVLKNSQNKRKRPDDEEVDQITITKRTKVDSTKRRRRRRVPPRGTLDTQAGKPWATLDTSGKKLVIYPNSGPDRPNWLAKAIDDTEGVQSAAASPRALLEELSEGCSTPRLNHVDLDDQNLNELSAISMISPSQEGLSLEIAFDHFPPEVWLNQDGDVEMNVEDPDLSDPENEADLANFIDSEYYSSDEESENGPPAPFNKGHGNHMDGVSHLNNNNVTSFRRRLDPIFDPIYEDLVSMGHPASAAATALLSASLPGGSTLASPVNSNLRTPRLSRGHRRNTSNSPFSSPRYNNASPFHEC